VGHHGAVTGVERPADDVVILHLAGGDRVVVRPSGTEPKVKCYLQVVVAEIEPGTEGYLGARTEAEHRLDELQDAIGEATGLG